MKHKDLMKLKWKLLYEIMPVWVGWKVQFSCLALCFCCISVTFSDISPADKWSFLLKFLMSFIDLGSWKPYLWNIILALSPTPWGSSSYPYFHSSTYNGAWNTVKYWLTRWSWGLRLKRVLLCSRLGIWSVRQSLPHTSWRNREEGDQGDLERDLEVRIWAESPTSYKPLSLNICLCPYTIFRALAQGSVENLEGDLAKV